MAACRYAEAWCDRVCYGRSDSFSLQGLCLQPHEHRRRRSPVLGEGHVHQCLGDGGGSGRRCPARGRFLLSRGPDLQGPPQEHPRRSHTVRHRRATPTGPPTNSVLVWHWPPYISTARSPPFPRFGHSVCMEYNIMLARACPGGTRERRRYDLRNQGTGRWWQRRPRTCRVLGSKGYQLRLFSFSLLLFPRHQCTFRFLVVVGVSSRILQLHGIYTSHYCTCPPPFILVAGIRLHPAPR